MFCCCGAAVPCASAAAASRVVVMCSLSTMGTGILSPTTRKYVRVLVPAEEEEDAEQVMLRDGVGVSEQKLEL